MKTIIVIIHFWEEDTECMGDYYYVTLEMDGKKIATFGDYYHDKGYEKAEGFIQGFECALGEEVSDTWINVADAKE